MKRINVRDFCGLFVAIFLLFAQARYVFCMEGEGGVVVEGAGEESPIGDLVSAVIPSVEEAVAPLMAGETSARASIKGATDAKKSRQLTLFDFKGLYAPLKDDYKCLSPMLGAVWFKKGIIESMYRCGPADAVTTCVRSWFNLIPGGDFQISKSTTLPLFSLSPVAFGAIAGILYVMRKDTDTHSMVVDEKNSYVKLINYVVKTYAKKGRGSLDFAKNIVNACCVSWGDDSLYPWFTPWALLTGYLYEKDIDKPELHEYFKGILVVMDVAVDDLKSIGVGLGEKIKSDGIDELLIGGNKRINSAVRSKPAVNPLLQFMKKKPFDEDFHVAKFFKEEKEPDWSAQFTVEDKKSFAAQVGSWSTLDHLCEHVEEVAFLGLQGNLPALESGQKTIRQGTADCIETALKNLIRIALHDSVLGRLNKQKTFSDRSLDPSLLNFLHTPYATLEAEHYAFGDLVENQPMIVYATMKTANAVKRQRDVDGYVHIDKGNLPREATVIVVGDVETLIVGPTGLERKYVLAPANAELYELQPTVSNIIILMDKLLGLGLFEGKILEREFCNVDFAGEFFPVMLKKLGFERVHEKDDARDVMQFDKPLSMYNHHIRLCVGANEEAMFELELHSSGHGGIKPLVSSKFYLPQQKSVLAALKSSFSPANGILYASVASLERRSSVEMSICDQMVVDMPMPQLQLMINLHSLGDTAQCSRCLEKTMELMGLLPDDDKKKEALQKFALRLINPNRVGFIRKMSMYPQELIMFYRVIMRAIIEHESDARWRWNYDSEVINFVTREAVGAFMINRGTTVVGIKEDMAGFVCSLLDWGAHLPVAIAYSGHNFVKVDAPILVSDLKRELVDFILDLKDLPRDFWVVFWANFFAVGNGLLSMAERCAIISKLLDGFDEHREKIVESILRFVRDVIANMRIQRNNVIIQNVFELLKYLFTFDPPLAIKEAIDAARIGIDSNDAEIRLASRMLFKQMLALDKVNASLAAQYGMLCSDPEIQRESQAIFERLPKFVLPQGVSEISELAARADMQKSNPPIKRASSILFKWLLSLDITHAVTAAQYGMNSSDPEVRRESQEVFKRALRLDQPLGVKEAIGAALYSINSLGDPEIMSGLLMLFDLLFALTPPCGVREAIDAARIGIDSNDAKIRLASRLLFKRVFALDKVNASLAAQYGMLCSDPEIQRESQEMFERFPKFVLPQGVSEISGFAARADMQKSNPSIKRASSILFKWLLTLEDTHAVAAAQYGMNCSDPEVRRESQKVFERVLRFDPPLGVNEAIGAAQVGIKSDNSDIRHAAIILFDQLFVLNPPQGINEAIAIAKGFARLINRLDLRKTALELFLRLLALDPPQGVMEARAAAQSGVKSKDPEIMVTSQRLLELLPALTSP